jgi:hypothetical protein
MMKNTILTLLFTLGFGTVCLSDDLTQSISLQCYVVDTHLQTTDYNSSSSENDSVIQDRHDLIIKVSFTDRSSDSSPINELLTDTEIDFIVTIHDQVFWFDKHIEGYYYREFDDRLSTSNRDGTDSEFGEGFIDIHNFQHRLILKSDSTKDLRGFLISTIEKENEITHKSVQIRCLNFEESWLKIYNLMRVK